MANTIKITKGLDIKISGKAAEKISKVPHSVIFEVNPDYYHEITPKLVVKEGDSVLAGTPLFFEKNSPGMNFVSPVSGKVKEIIRGERRKVLHITIETDKTIEYKKFQMKSLSEYTIEDIRSLLLESGLWTFIKQRPYDIIADPAKTPKSIFISTFDTSPLAPDYEFIIREQLGDFQTGIDILAKLTEGKVHLGLKSENSIFSSLKGVETTVFSGPHPAGNVGVQINHVNPVNKGETVWTINPQDVLFIGRLFSKGIVDGNVLVGRKISENGHLGPYCSQITVIDEGTETHELLGWAMPRFNKFSASRLFFSKLLRNKEFKYDARLMGGRRAIIMSGEYDKVFPMDILPEFLIKAMIAKNIDKMENLGAYEVAPEDFALCEFVDTSKLPLQAIVRYSLDMLKKEVE
ncbi:MAG: NADH:ubiquinone reductase ((+)-transporting) subunit [Bacteroidetes bacterium]|nr:NADH:ubiquinone reductase ((+)-transporting) subunit [Bacteroidota bacterium]